MALFESLEQRENTIHPLCSDALKNMVKINKVTETLVSSFVDNHEDFGELLVDDDDGELAVLIQKKLSDVPNAWDDAIFSVIQRMADYSTEEAATTPSFTSSTEDLDHYDKVIIELTIKNL